jgi:FKBP-type peptidyl-prolyl cis-trans isomerase FklB
MVRNFSTATLAAMTGIVTLLAVGQVSAGSSSKFDTDEEKEAYSLGVVIASQATVGLGKMDTEAFISGVSDVIQEEQLALDESQITEALTRFEARRAEESQLAVAAQIESNRVAGDTFRASFAEDPEVKTLASGLHYKILRSGEGDKPSIDSTVTLHYRGSLVDGREIDNSYERNEPVTIQVSQAIPGWTEALTHMPVGSKWKVVVPPELAYGKHGAGSLIEPGATVIFEMELIGKS